MQTFQLLICGTRISFRAEGDPADIERAREVLTERAERLQSCAKLMSKDQLFAFLALNVVDELLQSQKRQKEIEERLVALLAHIDDSASGSGAHISLGGA